MLRLDYMCNQLCYANLHHNHPIQTHRTAITTTTTIQKNHKNRHHHLKTPPRPLHISSTTMITIITICHPDYYHLCQYNCVLGSNGEENRPTSNRQPSTSQTTTKGHCPRHHTIAICPFHHYCHDHPTTKNKINYHKEMNSIKIMKN